MSDQGDPPGDEPTSEPAAKPTTDDAGPAPATTDDGGAGGAGGAGGESPTKRFALVGIVVFVLVAIGVGVLIATSGGDESGYDEETQANFMADCTADGGDDVAPACECWYDAIVENVSYDRFEEVSGQLVAIQEKDAGTEPVVPDDLLELLEPCKLPAEATDPADAADATTTTAADGGSRDGEDFGSVPPTAQPAVPPTTAAPIAPTTAPA